MARAADIVTQSGRPVSRLGLAGSPTSEPAFAATAFERGINYCFFYDTSFKGLVAGVKDLCSRNREAVFVATGTESRDPAQMRARLDEARNALDVDVIDAFYAEYVNPSDDADQVLGPGGAVAEILRWKGQDKVRYVGATAHNRPLALRLIQSGRIDVLMHRYNMAHRKSEEEVLPAALKAGIPVVAFTSTRWGWLLKGHPEWAHRVPTAADCYRFVLVNPAIRVALTAPATAEELEENLAMLEDAAAPDVQTVQKWEAYGALVYGTGQDAFETEWP